MSKTVMIVTGETSGELYGSLLADCLKKRFPDINVIGIGGERMQASGVEIISGFSSAFGLAEAVSSLKEIKKTFRKAVETLTRCQPQVLVLIDYPDFNLKLAEEAKKKNIKVLYYVSPQVWAWRKKRINKIARLVDRMAVLLPFEENIYRDIGLDCEFVGHPVLDEIEEMVTEKTVIRKELGISENMPLLSLLPGSRPHELQRLLPLITNIIREFKKEFSEFQFCVPFAPNTDMQKYGYFIESLKNEGVIVNKGKSLATLIVSDLAVIASGTASLQAAFMGVPMVVIYKVFPLTYWLGKLIVKVKYMSLVNILAEKQVVKELLQSEATPQNIISEIKKMVFDKTYKEEILRSFDRVRQMFAGKKASERVAEMVAETAGWKI